MTVPRSRHKSAGAGYYSNVDRIVWRSSIFVSSSSAGAFDTSFPRPVRRPTISCVSHFLYPLRVRLSKRFGSTTRSTEGLPTAAPTRSCSASPFRLVILVSARSVSTACSHTTGRIKIRLVPEYAISGSRSNLFRPPQERCTVRYTRYGIVRKRHVEQARRRSTTIPIRHKSMRRPVVARGR